MLLLATLAATGVTPPSHAEPDAAVTRTAAVAYADLDLSDDAGAQSLYRRIRVAARAVCTATDLDFDLEARRRQRACARDAVAGAVERIGSDSLTRLHRSAAAQANRLW